MSNLQITGKLFSATPVEQKSDSFRVRQFTLEITESGANGQAFTNYAGFQLVNDKCALLDTMAPGQTVTVHFNIRGNIWNDKTITNLQAWKIDAVQVQQQAPPPQQFQQQAPPQQQQWSQQVPQQQVQQPQQQQWPQPSQQQPDRHQPWPQPQQNTGFGQTQPATNFNPPPNNGSAPF